MIGVGNVCTLAQSVDDDQESKTDAWFTLAARDDDDVSVPGAPTGCRFCDPNKNAELDVGIRSLPVPTHQGLCQLNKDWIALVLGFLSDGDCARVTRACKLLHDVETQHRRWLHRTIDVQTVDELGVAKVQPADYWYGAME